MARASSAALRSASMVARSSLTSSMFLISTTTMASRKIITITVMMSVNEGQKLSSASLS